MIYVGLFMGVLALYLILQGIRRPGSGRAGDIRAGVVLMAIAAAIIIYR